MADDADRPDGFTPPGNVSVAPAALARIEVFWRETGPTGPDSSWIVGFSWASRRSVESAGSGEAREMGPGLDLSAFRRAEVPAEVIHRQGKIEYFIQIPRAVWMASRDLRIDVDPAAFGGFVLR